ncbi:hypothetical protein DPMN_120356 [Dreissena polymorpha]|uniref:Protein sleepless n=1 Tax=Dreissena polymorpha TaxID=45954 RepID=A0A9D4GK21_DREPO|nr:hypothetical protein DPMN_120356 [Dreissena polymorpha]
MEFIAILVAVICLIVVTAPVTGLTCYACASVLNPATCDVDNFDPRAHSNDTIKTVSHLPDKGKECNYCTKAYFHDPTSGFYTYARGCENSPRGVGCLKDACACTTDLCNSAVTMTTTSTSLLALLLPAIVNRLIWS